MMFYGRHFGQIFLTQLRPLNVIILGDDIKRMITIIVDFKKKLLVNGTLKM